jgi:UDP-glucose 4-epimerase|tara:strand:+ start:653 stop:1504 length:852 start_codon:yes stop_codon:yes gene_type:complete
MKTIVVTGGKGFVGRNLIRLLLENNFKVISIDEKRSNRRNKNNYNQSFSIKSFFKEKKKLKKINGIIHLAALSRNSLSFNNPLKLFKKNLIDTLIILETIRYLKKKPWFIFSSTKQIEIDKKNNLYNLYSITKESCEKIIKSYASNFGIKSIILRFSDVFGTVDNSKEKVLVKLISTLKKNKKFNIIDPSYKLNYVHVDDICEYILFLIKQNPSKNYREINLYGKKTYFLKDIAFFVKKMINSKSKILISKKKYKKTINNKAKTEKFLKLKKEFKKELKFINP